MIVFNDHKANYLNYILNQNKYQEISRYIAKSIFHHTPTSFFFSIKVNHIFNNKCFFHSWCFQKKVVCIFRQF